MKKLLLICICAVLVLGLFGCGAGTVPDIEDVLASDTPWYQPENELTRAELNAAWGEPETAETSRDVWNVDGKYVAVSYDGDIAVSIGRSYTMYAEIVEISGDLAIIEPAPDQWERKSGDRIFFSLSWLPEGTEAAVGTKLCIEYDGLLMETYPMQINKPFRVETVK